MTISSTHEIDEARRFYPRVSRVPAQVCEPVIKRADGHRVYSRFPSKRAATCLPSRDLPEYAIVGSAPCPTSRTPQGYIFDSSIKSQYRQAPKHE